jgi:hypothetical protein
LQGCFESAVGPLLDEAAEFSQVGLKRPKFEDDPAFMVRREQTEEQAQEVASAVMSYWAGQPVTEPGVLDSMFSQHGKNQPTQLSGRIGSVIQDQLEAVNPSIANIVRQGELGELAAVA